MVDSLVDDAILHATLNVLSNRYLYRPSKKRKKRHNRFEDDLLIGQQDDVDKEQDEQQEERDDDDGIVIPWLNDSEFLQKY